MSETYSTPVYGPRLAGQGSVLGKEIFIVGKNDGNAHLGGRCHPKLGIAQRIIRWQTTKHGIDALFV